MFYGSICTSSKFYILNLLVLYLMPICYFYFYNYKVKKIDDGTWFDYSCWNHLTFMLAFQREYQKLMINSHLKYELYIKILSLNIAYHFFLCTWAFNCFISLFERQEMYIRKLNFYKHEIYIMLQNSQMPYLAK